MVRPDPGGSEQKLLWGMVDGKCPYEIGTRLWVRETWGAVWPDEYPVPLEQCKIEYKADTNNPYPGDWPADEARGNDDAPKWRASIHMPRWASRLSLEIVSVRVERVQEISFDDAIAEGVCADPHGVRSESRRWFSELWDSINAKRGYGWDVNPWVWVIEFKVIE
jgi:hypothetical protein